MTTREEDRARALAEWLDDPSSGPPPELEPDVVEGISGLRPDLAPPPRVTAESILAGVTSGPLAVPSSATAPPTTVDAPPANSPRRWWRAVGGAGGVGLVLAVAATFLLVVLPQAHLSSSPDASPALEAEPAAQAPTTKKQEQADTDAPAAQPLRSPEPSVRPRPAPAAPPEISAPPPPAELAKSGAAPTPARAAPAAKLDEDGLVGGVLGGEAAPVGQSGLSLVADAGVVDDALEEVDALDAVADLGDEDEELAAEPPRFDMDDALPMPSATRGAFAEAAPAARSEKPRKERARRPSKQAAEEPVPSPSEAAPLGLDALRATALPTSPGGGTPAGLDPAVLGADAEARARAAEAAARGELASAGDILSGRVVPPAALGQARAVEAARHYLAAGDPRAASAVAQVGLALGAAPSADRAWLLILHGDALRQLGDSDGAATAYRAAAVAR